MSKIEIHGNVVGNNNQFGDRIYLSFDEFVNNGGIELSETERELVKIIFANTNSEDERKEILDSLRNIQGGSSVGTEKENSVNTMAKFLIRLKKFGNEVAAHVVANWISGKIENFDIQNYLQNTIK